MFGEMGEGGWSEVCIELIVRARREGKRGAVDLDRVSSHHLRP